MGEHARDRWIRSCRRGLPSTRKTEGEPVPLPIRRAHPHPLRPVPLLLLMVLLLPAVAAAHPEGALRPAEFWRTWTLDPWVIVPMLASAWLYARGLRRLWARAGVGRGVRRWQAWCFAAGQGALFIALVSPLDSLGGALFSAHMLQHVVLMIVAAPLLVLGVPLIPFLWALPPVWRARVGGWTRLPLVRRVWRPLSRPVGAWTLHAAAIWVWHAPALYQATLYSEGVHIAQHASFFLTALLFWWAAADLGRRSSGRFGFGVLFVFTTAVHSSILGALLTFSLVLWYPVYAERTAAWGLTPLEDQQLGGLVMWVPAGIIYVVAALALLAVGLSAPARGLGVRSRASKTAGFEPRRPPSGCPTSAGPIL
jgi:putative membrane protein